MAIADAWYRAVKINGKRRQIAKILHSSTKIGVGEANGGV